MSGRSNAFLNSFGPKSKFAVQTNLIGFSKNGSFIPAKARIALIVTGTTETSAITGRKYKDKTGAAYTIPRGQDPGALGYQQAIDAILDDNAFKGASATHTVSFAPEEFRRD